MQVLAKVASRQLMLYNRENANANKPASFATTELLPKFTKTETGYTLRWESPDKAWWAEFNYLQCENEKSTFRGTNVPSDCKLTKIEEVAEGNRFSYESAMKPKFWARITLTDNSSTKKLKVEAKVPIPRGPQVKKTKIEELE